MKANIFTICMAALVIGVLPAADIMVSGQMDIPRVKAWQGTGTGEKEQTFAPQLEADSIRYGNKTLRMTPDGRIECVTPDCGILFSGGAGFFAKIDGKTRGNWQKRNLDPEQSKFYREGRKYIWELWFKDQDTPAFNGLKQVLEVLPDGRISLSYQFDLPAGSGKVQFKPWTFVFSLPGSSWLNRTAVLNGRETAMNEQLKSYSSTGKIKEYDWLFGKNSPALKFSVLAIPAKGGSPCISYRKFGKTQDFMLHFNHSSKCGKTYQFTLDLRKGSAAAGKDIRGGIDFRAQENIQLPDNRRTNLVNNPSFERGLEEWISLFQNRDGQWDWEPFALDSREAYDGKCSLRMDLHKFSPPVQTKVPNIGPFSLVCDPGFYTISFYAKCQPGKKSFIYCWIPNYHRGNPYLALNNNKAIWKFPVTPEWKRYQATVEIKRGEPLMQLCFFGGDPSGSGSLWLDAVQVNCGKTAPEFRPVPAEGRLLTSAPDNFVSSKEKIGGKLLVTTAKPDTAGKVRVTVKNFFGELLLDETRDFRSGKDRTAELALPLDKLPGLGVFVVKAEYRLADGSEAYDYHRYAHVEFLTGPQPMKAFYGMDYYAPHRRYNFLKQIDRWDKLGVGGKHHAGTKGKATWDTYKKYNIQPFSASLLCYQKSKSGPHIDHFFIMDSDEKPVVVLNPDDPKLIFRDYHLESGGKITPEYLNKLKQACKHMAAKYPYVKLWSLGGEITCKMPNDWWGKGDTDQDVIRKLALHLKAFAEGIHEGNPDAKVYQDDPANMDPRGGIAETDRLLAECNKIGVKFDVIAIHPYRFSPENPDLDDDTVKFLEVLKKHGYGKTPIYWPEGMLWGPFNLPQWGTISSSGQRPPRTWRGSLSYDMGWTEKKSAAWFARAWLIALKYSDRVIGATSGQTVNNCYMDTMLTPYAAQLVPNTLCGLFGKIRFKKDIRFAPYVRTYVFEDDRKRPIAAVWCHNEKVDNGSEEAPTASADFGNSLEAVIDLMNTKRNFKLGPVSFQVSPFPLFFRGKPGTLKQMIAAFENAELISKSSTASLALSITPSGKDKYQAAFKNYISKEFNGKLNGKAVRIPASGTASVELPLGTPLKGDSVVRQNIPLKLVSNNGREYDSSFDLHAFLIRRVPVEATVDTLDWNALPKVPLDRTIQNKKRVSGFFRTGWNHLGLFIEATIRDDKFVHVEYPKPFGRWKNDCLQIYIDTMANAQRRILPGCDEDDYVYALFPDSKGTSAQVFRYRTVDPQLGLATQAPQDETFAPDMPCRFTRKDGMLIYRVFFPAKYLLPMKLQKGWCFGFCLFAPDSDLPGKVDDYLTLTTDGKSPHERPKSWPMALLAE